MMSTCSEVNDDLADLVAGDPDAIARHAEHLASCDACRDARHEATRLVARLEDAGRDHVPVTDLADRVLARVDAEAARASTPSREEPPRVPAEEPAHAAPRAATTEATRREPARRSGVQPSAPRPVRRRPADATPRRTSRAWLAVGAAVAIAAGGVGLVATFRGDAAPERATPPLAGDGSIGSVQTIARAAADGASGLELETAGAWGPLVTGAELPAGARLRTDERTRARLVLADGTELVLDHGTALSFDTREPRRISMTAGRLAADVAQVLGRPAAITTPAGTIDVLGTKLVVTATPRVTSVQVVRGHVALTTGAGEREDVFAGEEGLVEGGVLSVAAAPSLASELAWSELASSGAPPATADDLVAGLGALRAYKPGEKRDRDWNLALASHEVKVRIVGPIARTEITETFRNDSDETLEGVYQFPLPPDAQIDGLSLDLPDQPGGFLDGAFVAKDRAHKIWQGVIDRATPQQIARPESEIIWVPGRWRDPALLDWKRGGRFELRVFPIPAKGQRTIKLSYTQVVTARGPHRQYVYPLAHSRDGSTVADRFAVDVEVRGAVPGALRSTGYPLAPGDRGDVQALSLATSGFVPRGDLVIDYRASDGDAELRAWTFAGGVAVAPDDKLAAKKGVGIDPEVIAAQRAVAADARPTAVLALRPALPRWRETRPRDLTIVIDASQSMVGERYRRATELAAAIVAQMDRRDRFTVAACDSECRRLGDLRVPSMAAADEATRWLEAQPVAGASDLVAAIRSAADLPAEAGRERWVLYLGDGFATTGFRRVADVERALAEVAERGVQVTTIGIGGDADRALLAAAARGGGGSHLAWVPGQSVGNAALAALAATQGASLRDASVELPAGLVDVAPTVLPTIRAGEEVLLAARITGDVRGDVIVRGKVGGQPFEQRYPLALDVSSAPGNAFVPRLWASLAIEQLERAGDGDGRIQTIALSQAYGVMSKETSLLVLESPAMFDAFGIDRGSPAAKWTGEEALDEVVATGALDVAKNVDQPQLAGATGKGRAATLAPSAEVASGLDSRARGAARDEKIASTSAPAPWSTPPAPGMIGYRRTWVRVPAVSAYDGVSAAIRKAVADGEAALVASPDSREKHRALVQALAFAGELDRAREIADRWRERDELDAQALGYLADLLGRDGQRELALRTLAGLVDLDADRAALHERLVRAYETSGRRAQACAHRVALSALSPRDVRVAGAAIRCLRAIGRAGDAELVARGLPDDRARAAAEKAATVAALAPRIAGELVIEARWEPGADLDISLVTPQGTRVSWMGGRDDAHVADATSTRAERLALRSIRRGNYLLEVTRSDGSQGPIRGTLDVTVLGTKHALPFELHGARAVVGRLAISLEERLEQIAGFGMVPTGAPRSVELRLSGFTDQATARVVKARAGVLRACYQRELGRNPTLRGRVLAALEIDEHGAAGATITGDAMPPAVTACLRAQLRRMRFPTGDARTARFVMTFTSDR